jgi:hypothetical protein
MVNDGIEVAEQLVRRLGQPRIALMASPWGSALGVHMIRRRPELFSLYVGGAQLVSLQADADSSYALTLAAVVAADDARQLAALKAIGPPPWSTSSTAKTTLSCSSSACATTACWRRSTCPGLAGGSRCRAPAMIRTSRC